MVDCLLICSVIHGSVVAMLKMMRIETEPEWREREWVWRMTGLFGHGRVCYTDPRSLAGHHAFTRDPARMIENREQNITTFAGWWDRT